MKLREDEASVVSLVTRLKKMMFSSKRGVGGVTLNWEKNNWELKKFKIQN